MEDTKLAKELSKPFPLKDIEWRVQRAMRTQRGDKAIVLPYITNRAIMTRLDEVFGPGNWKNEFTEWRDNGVLCGISAKIDGEWVTKRDGAEETQVEAVKGGFSGSMKRAAVQWGIGRYLYDLEESWVDVKEKGEVYIKSKIKVNGKDEYIQGYWNKPSLPAWAIPSPEGQNSSQPQPQHQSQPQQQEQPQPLAAQDDAASKEMITMLVGLATEMAYLKLGSNATEDAIKEEKNQILLAHNVRRGINADDAAAQIAILDDELKTLIASQQQESPL